MAHVDLELDRLTPAERRLARRVRRAAAIVAAAGLPALYRPAAFERVLEAELLELELVDGDDDGDVVPVAA